MEKWSAQTKELPALKVGQHVNIQNQHGAGKVAKRWDRTGVVVEDIGYNKYKVRIDGSGRVTDRNRQFLRTFKPATTTYSPGITKTTPDSVSQPPIANGESSIDPQVTTPEVPLRREIILEATPDVQTPHVDYNPAPVAKSTPQPELHQPTPAVGSEQIPGPHAPLRRSVRVRKPNQLYGSDVYDLSRH